MRWFWGIIGAIALLAVGALAGVAVASARDGEAAARPPAAGASVVVFGDSWTAGYWSEPLTSGFAYLTADRFEWDAQVLGEPGTGFIQKGKDEAKDRSFPTRAAELQVDSAVELVVLEGSINDTVLNLDTPANPTADQLKAAVAKTLTELRRAYPSARIIALGPTGPDPVPELDSMLSEIYAGEGISYITAVDWITPSMPWAWGDQYHPSTQGHAFLAGRLAAALDEVYARG